MNEKSIEIIFKYINIIPIVLVMPFWYLIVYVFNKPLFINSQIQIPIIIAFCLSYLWAISCGSIMNTFFRKSIRDEKDKDELARLQSGITSATVALSTTLISAFAIAAYFLCCRFLYVIIIPFIIVVPFAIIYAIRAYQIDNKQKDNSITDNKGK